MPQFEDVITYGQINVFDGAEADFNLWNDDHVAQGFAWCPGHVSFGVPDHDGNVLVDVEVAAGPPELTDDVLRALKVPIRIVSDATIATVISEHAVDLSPGAYSVHFMLRPGFVRDGDALPIGYRIAITFVPDPSEQFAILRRDGEITAETAITTTAQPAI